MEKEITRTEVWILQKIGSIDVLNANGKVGLKKKVS